MIGRRIVIGLLTGLVAAGCDRTTADEHLAKADAFAGKKMISEAIIEYRLAVQRDPTRVDAHIKLADAYLTDGQWNLALQESVAAADLAPNDANAQVKAAELLLSAKAFEDAKTRATKALAIDPKSVEALIVLGNALVRLADPDSAIAQMQKAMELQPADSRVYATIGTIAFVKGDNKEAEAAFRKAVEVAPNSVQAHASLGYYLWAVGHLNEGVQAFEAALAIDPLDDRSNRALAIFNLSTNRLKAAEPFLKVLAESSYSDRLRLADYYLSMNRTKEARQALAPRSTGEAADRRTKLALAVIDYADGRKDEAHKAIDDVLARTPFDSEAIVAKARLRMAESRPLDALALVERAASLDPHSEPVKHLLGTLYLELNRLEEARAAFLDLIKMNTRAVPARLHLANLELSTGHAESAVLLAREVLMLVPDDPEARLLLARGLTATGELRRAEAELRELARKFPNSASIHNETGLLLQSQHSPAEALRSFEKAVQLDPANMDAAENLVGALVEAGRVPEARRRIDELLAKTPRNSHLLTLSGQLAYRAGDKAGAEKLFKLAIDADSSYTVPYVALAELFVSQNRLDEARAEWEKVVERQPKAAGARTMIGMILEAQNKPDLALKQYQLALQADPGAAVAATNLASLYADRGENLTEALELARRARVKLPSAPAVNDTLGWLYYKSGSPQDAVPFLEQAVAGGPSKALHHYHLGMAYLAIKDDARAKASLDRALALSSDFPGAETARKTLASIRK